MRRALEFIDFLPVQEILHDLSDEEKICAHDPSHTLVEIGRESSDQLKFIPATVEILRHIRPKYACPNRRRLRTTNVLERLNRELKRRTAVATLFPNEASLLRLVTATVAEVRDEWEIGRAYLVMESE